jgi:predicted naringenin-chalcone synthase
MPFSIITSIGLANPAYKVPQSDIFTFMSRAHGLSPLENARLKKIYSGSGIEFRYSVLEDYSQLPGNFSFYGNGEELSPFPGTKRRAEIFKAQAVQLAYVAVMNCISPIPDFKLGSITHIITVSCTGFHAPGLDIELISKLGLSSDTERVCINFMGCYAGFNALKTADYISRSNPDYKILIVNVELCTLHFQRENNLQNWLSNALFGDGASATLIESESNPSGKGFSLRLKGFYSELMLQALQEMSWNIGDYGFEMHLSSHVTKSIKASIKTVAHSLMKKVKMNFSDMVHFAIHPGGRRILEVCEEELGFSAGPDHPSFQTLRQFGNMSSATIFYVLSDLMNQIRLEKVKSGPIMSFAFGPGLTFESMVLETLS